MLPVAVAGGLGGAGAFLWSALNPDGPDYLIPGLIAMLWASLVFTLVVSFQTVPPPPDPQAPWHRRWRQTLARGGSWLLAWLIVGGALTATWLSLRLLLLWRA